MSIVMCRVAGGGKPLKGDAQPADVIKGKTFSNKKDNNFVGTLVDQPAVVDAYSWTRSGGATYVREPQGARRTNADSGYPEVKIGDNLYGSKEYDDHYNAVTVSTSVSGRTVTATASNGKTASANVAYANGTSDGHVSVSTSGGSGNQDFDIADGYCTKITVDRTGAYNAGRSLSGTSAISPYAYAIAGWGASGSKVDFSNSWTATSNCIVAVSKYGTVVPSFNFSTNGTILASCYRPTTNGSNITTECTTYLIRMNAGQYISASCDSHKSNAEIGYVITGVSI